MGRVLGVPLNLLLNTLIHLRFDRESIADSIPQIHAYWQGELVKFRVVNLAEGERFKMPLGEGGLGSRAHQALGERKKGIAAIFARRGVGVELRAAE